MSLPECDPEIFKAEAIFVTHTIKAEDVEMWVKKVAKLSGQPVDWHYMGGMAVVRCLGNRDKVREAIKALLFEHDLLYIKAARKINPNYHSNPPRGFR